MIFHKEPPIWQNSERRTKPISVAEINKPSEMISGISEDVMDALVRTLLPDIISFCESEEGKAIFEKWKTEQSE